MNKLLKFILPIGLVPVLANCGNNTPQVETHYVTFHQELAADVKVPFTKYTTDGEIVAQEPKIVSKDGYSAKWEDYTIVDKSEDFTVNAIYEEYTYTAIFKWKGTIVDGIPFTVNDVKGEHPKLPESKTPKCPSDTWYTYEWEDYELSLNDITINAVQSGMVEHIAKFTDGDKVIVEKPFSRDDVTVDYVLKDEFIPNEVKNYKHDAIKGHEYYWDNNWDFSVPKDADKTVEFDANVTKHNFDLKFLDFDGEQIGETVQYQFDTNWSTMKKPATPSKVGYTVKWPTRQPFNFNPNVPTEVSPSATANDYHIKFIGKPYDQVVAYDAEYKLIYESEDDDLHMWHVGDKILPVSGTWKIPNDVTAELKPVTNISFDESGYIPKFISTQTASGSTQANNLKVVDDPLGNGGKVLEITVNNATDSAYLILSKEYLTQAFNTEGVKAIEFDAMATSDSINFCSRYKAHFKNQTTEDDRFFNNPYEVSQDGLGLGISKDRYKTFSFIKEYFTDKDSYEPIGGESGIKFMYGNFGKVGEKIYIKNIRLSTQDQIDYQSFEGGGINFNSSLYQFFYNTGGRGDSPNNRVPHCVATKKYMMVMDEKKTSDKSVTLTNEISKDGLTSLKIHKTVLTPGANSAFPCYMSGYDNSNPFYDKVSAVTFDIYCTSKYNGNSIKDGKSNFIPGFSATDFHEANTWYTMTLQISDANSTADGRFFYMAGGLVADFYLDNVKLTLK